MASTLEKDSPPPDFFVSYTGVDKEWAETIAFWLEEAGYRTFLQAWDFRPGHNFEVMIQLGTRAKHTVAVLSPAYLEAAVCQQEWSAAVSADPRGLQRKLIPVRVKHCTPDGLLRAIIYVDLVGLVEDEAREAIFAALPDRAKPPSKPHFPPGPKPATIASGVHENA